MNRLFIILLLMLFFLTFLPSAGWARDICSPHIGKATINEVYQQSSAFIEVKKIIPDASLDHQGWRLSVCRESSQGSNQRCNNYPLTNIQLKNGHYLVKSVDRQHIDIKGGGMDIRLYDSSGKIIDFLSVDGHVEEEEPNPNDCGFLYDTGGSSLQTSAQSKGVHRLPDGTGSWSEFGSGGATYTNSEGTSNNAYHGNNIYAFISIPDTVVYPGQPAVFTLTLRNEAGDVIPVKTGETLTVHYTTLDGTATAADHYTKPAAGSSVTLEAGTSTATIYVPTTSAAEMLDKYFYLVVTGITVTDGSSVVLMQNNKNYATATFFIHDFPVNSCFEENFETGLSHWSVGYSSGTFGPPSIVDYKLRLTNSSINIATIATLLYKFKSANEKLSLEFDFFSSGGGPNTNQFADGITIVFSDADVLPKAGGYGGSLGYAQRSSPSINEGFAGGWLGIGLDTFGNFSRNNEGRQGGVSSFRSNAVAIRGSGKGVNGYVYITGTESLNPPLRNAHQQRFRITLDSVTEGETWITVERKIDTEFEIIIPRFNVFEKSGNQAEVPRYLILSFTGSTGAQYGIHEISNLRICSGESAPSDLHHIRLEHNTQGLTCEAETVKVKACADKECDRRYTGEVTVELGFKGSTPAGASWESSSITFSGGEGEAKLRMTQPGEVTLKVVSPETTGNLICIKREERNETTDCKIRFADVGLRIGRFTGNNFDGGILTQIAGKPSNEGWNDSNLFVQVIRADPDNPTGACVAAVEGERDVRFSYSVVGEQGLTDNTIKINNDSGSEITSSTQSKTLTLDFGAEGKAPFYFVSDDTGRYRLTASLDIEVGESDSQTLTVTGDSNAFFVRPLAVFVDASGNPKALNHDGNVFTKAGVDFDLTFTPVRWTANADDDNKDGIWDKCGNSDFSPDENAKARVPAWSFTGPSPSLRLPVNGNSVNLSYPADNNGASGVSFATKTDAKTVEGVSYSEVGIIQFSTGADSASINTVDFLGEEVAVCSPHIGRFIPHHLHIDPGSVTGACGLFTYFGQDGFITTFTLQARNKQEVITENYIGDFAKFDVQSDNYEFTATNLPAGFSWDRSLDESFPHGVWNAGEAQVEAKHWVRRPSSPIGPLRLTIQAQPEDDDNVTTSSGAVTVHINNGPELRYGRLRVGTGHAHLETDDVEVTVEAQYFDGSRWVLNTADTCSHLLAGAFRLSNDQEQDQSPTIKVGDGTSTLTAGNWSGGKQTLTLSAPGADNSGFVDITALLNDKAWLQYDWGSGNVTDNPTGRASWGLYRGHPNVIYLREIWR